MLRDKCARLRSDCIVIRLQDATVDDFVVGNASSNPLIDPPAVEHILLALMFNNSVKSWQMAEVFAMDYCLNYGTCSVSSLACNKQL